MPRSGFPKKDLYGENPKSTHNATFPVSPVELKRLTWRNSRPTTTTPYNLARDPPGVFSLLSPAARPGWRAQARLAAREHEFLGEAEAYSYAAHAVG
jgi:hypothetical protein